jgi:hypothetical protein
LSVRQLLLIAALVLAVALVLAAPAAAKVTKFTFNDVTYPDGTTGEIEASVKNTNQSHLTYCGYFSDDYRESLGYYQEFSETTASTNPEEVKAFCLESFDERFQ